MSQNLYKVEYDLTFINNSNDTFSYNIIFRNGSSSFLYYSQSVNQQTINRTEDRLVNLSFNPNTIEYISDAPPRFPGDTFCDNNTIIRPYDNTFCTFFPQTSGCPIPMSNGGPLVMYRIQDLDDLNFSNGANNELTSCDSRQINVSNCTSSSFSYKVDYQLGSNGPIMPLLPYGRRITRFTISANDFPGISINNPILRLIVSYDESNSSESIKILPLNFVQCSPEITDIITTNTECSYSDDGGFTVTFDRPLDTDNNEMLTSLSLTDATNDVFDDADDVELFQAIASTTYSGTQFTWPMSIPAGRYRLIYQSDGANSMEQYDPIIITSPPPLEYEVVIESDISCFNEANGSVRININPNNNGSIGSGNYYYTIGSNTTQNNFTGTTTIVNNLDTTTTIKVFDGNDCTERQ